MAKKLLENGEEHEITTDMIDRTLGFAYRLGFPYVTKVHAITTYVNPETEEKYTEERAREIALELGIDIEADEAEIKAQYERDQEYLRQNPIEYCVCGHSEGQGHNLYDTGACQWKDCDCGFFITQQMIRERAYYKWEYEFGVPVSEEESQRLWDEASSELREESRREYPEKMQLIEELKALDYTQRKSYLQNWKDSRKCLTKAD